MKDIPMQREKWLKREDARANNSHNYYDGEFRQSVKQAVNPERPNPRYDHHGSLTAMDDTGEYVEKHFSVPAGASHRQVKRARMAFRKEETARKEVWIAARAQREAELREIRMSMGFGEW